MLDLYSHNDIYKKSCGTSIHTMTDIQSYSGVNVWIPVFLCEQESKQCMCHRGMPDNDSKPICVSYTLAVCNDDRDTQQRDGRVVSWRRNEAHHDTLSPKTRHEDTAKHGTTVRAVVVS